MKRIYLFIYLFIYDPFLMASSSNNWAFKELKYGTASIYSSIFSDDLTQFQGLVGYPLFGFNSTQDYYPHYGNTVVLSRDGKNIIFTPVNAQIGSFDVGFPAIKAEVNDSLTVNIINLYPEDSSLLINTNVTTVALNKDGTVIFLGEPYWSNSGLTGSNQAGRVFVYENEDRNENITLIRNGEKISGNLGFSIAANYEGNVFAVGEPEWNNSNYGQVLIFKKNTNNSTWFEYGNIFNTGSIGTRYGHSLALNKDGNILALGEPSWYNGSAFGRVRTFKYSNNTGLSNFKLFGDKNTIHESEIHGNFAGEETGFSIALNDVGDVLIVGIPGYNGNDQTGKVKVFKYNSLLDSWLQVGQDLIGTAPGDLFGQSVSIDSDGDTIAIGSPGWSENNGKVYVYNLINNEWQKIFTYKGENNNKAGKNVSLDGSGTRIAFSEPDYFLAENLLIKISGRVKVFDLKKNNLLESVFYSYLSFIHFPVATESTNVTSPLHILNTIPLNFSQPLSLSSKYRI